MFVFQNGSCKKTSRATGIKFCMSSILYRPDCWKTRILPDARALKKLVRNPKYPPVLRGILESLIQYLMQDLPKKTPEIRNRDKPGSAAQTITSTGFSHRENETPEEQTEFEGSNRQAHLSEVGKGVQAKTAEAGSNRSEKYWLDKQENKCKVDQKAGGLISQRLTTFQLLQSKFLRSVPKPFVTQQREVGTLSSIRGVLGHNNHSQDREHDIHTRDRPKRVKGLKRQSSVKEIVAKFAMAEQKEQRLNTKKQPIKPMLIRRGVFLSSLMEKFETIATVHKGNDFKCLHKSASGFRFPAGSKETVACLERETQQEGQTVHKENPQTKLKSANPKLKGNQDGKGQEEISNEEVAFLTNGDSPTKDKHHMQAKQMEKQASDQELNSSLHQMRGPVNDTDVHSLESADFSETQTTVDETEFITKMVNFGCLELLLSTVVTEWSLPKPYRLSLQEEPPLSMHVATITTCAPVWSTGSSQLHLKETKPEMCECPNLDKMPKNTTDTDHGNRQLSSSQMDAGEDFATTTEDDTKLIVRGCSIDPLNGDMANEDVTQSTLRLFKEACSCMSPHAFTGLMASLVLTRLFPPLSQPHTQKPLLP